MKNKRKKRHAKRKELRDYDMYETSAFIDRGTPLVFEDLGLKLPEAPPTQVVSIRLPSELLNELKAFGSQHDIPYQALIKLLLFESIAELKKKSA